MVEMLLKVQLIDLISLLSLLSRARPARYKLQLSLARLNYTYQLSSVCIHTVHLITMNAHRVTRLAILLFHSALRN